MTHPKLIKLLTDNPESILLAEKALRKDEAEAKLRMANMDDALSTEKRETALRSEETE